MEKLFTTRFDDASEVIGEGAGGSYPVTSGVQAVVKRLDRAPRQKNKR